MNARDITSLGPAGRSACRADNGLGLRSGTRVWRRLREPYGRVMEGGLIIWEPGEPWKALGSPGGVLLCGSPFHGDLNTSGKPKTLFWAGYRLVQTRGCVKRTYTKKIVLGLLPGKPSSPKQKATIPQSSPLWTQSSPELWATGFPGR